MNWYKITVDTTIYAQELVSSMLYDMGIIGVEIINNHSVNQEEETKISVDRLPKGASNDAISKVVFYIDKNEDIDKLKEDLIKGLDELREFIDIGSGIIEVTVTKDEDWANNWKKYFKPFRVSDNIVIKPTWEAITDSIHLKDDDIIIEIDPEMAFGTGSHETTRLAIKEIKKYLKAGQNILDLGCGSGILSIISKKLGAGMVTATDIDKKSVAIAKENRQINKLTDSDIKFLHGNVLDEKESEELDKEIGLAKYDIVVANILADVIMDLSSIVKKYLKEDGYFISTGILKVQAKRVEERLVNNGFEIIEENDLGEWISIIAK